MKQKLLSKYLIAGIIALSMFSFAYVNLHSVCAHQSSCENKSQKNHAVLMEEEKEEARDLPIPDVNTISKVLNIVQRLTSTKQ
jgi:hypothetical protein